MKRFILAALLCVLISSTAYAVQHPITQEGAFDSTIRNAINTDIAELYATVGGAPFGITATTGTFSSTLNADGAVTFGSTVGITGATTAAAITGSGTLTLDDNSGASPSFTLQDATNETALFSKVDAGYLTLTSDATDGFNQLVGNLKVGNGTPGVTLNGEDAYVEGTFEVDGATQFDGNVTVGANSFTTTGVISVDGATVNKKSLSLSGRAQIKICGDGTTINNNTVYYGPSMVTVAGAGRVCDITQVGNATEATADEKAFDATAFQILSMDCLTADPGAAGVTFTVNSAAAGLTPAITCTVANTKLGCTTATGTTTAIASGAVIDIAASSTGNQGATPFACTLEVAY